MFIQFLNRFVRKNSNLNLILQKWQLFWLPFLLGSENEYYICVFRVHFLQEMSKENIQKREFIGKLFLLLKFVKN